MNPPPSQRQDGERAPGSTGPSAGARRSCSHCLVRGFHRAALEAALLAAAVATLGACDIASLTGHERKPDPQERPVQMDSPFADQPGPTTPAREAEFDDPDFTLTAEAVHPCRETAPFPPPPGFRRLSVPVRVQAKGKRLVPIGPLSFQLVDSRGQSFGPTLAGCDAALPSRNLESNELVTGYVAFDVPQGVGDLELQFEPFLIGRPKVRASVQVPKSDRSSPVRPQ